MLRAAPLQPLELVLTAVFSSLLTEPDEDPAVSKLLLVRVSYIQPLSRLTSLSG